MQKRKLESFYPRLKTKNTLEEIIEKVSQLFRYLGNFFVQHFVN